MSRIAVVIAGGDRPSSTTFAVLPPPAVTIAADSGVDHAHFHDLAVDVVVGDLDSASAVAIDWATASGAVVEAHPTKKDRTDLELALDRAAAASVDEVVVVGLGGGRIDHWLANLLVLAGPSTAAIQTTAYIDNCRISVVRDKRTLVGRPGEVVTLLALGGPALGVTTNGLEYRLENEDLPAVSARGVSNTFSITIDERLSDRDSREVVGEVGGTVSATVSVESGTILALQPHALAGSEAAHPSLTSDTDA